MEFTSRTYAHAVDREQYSQTNANANACKRKLIIVMDAWAIFACKRDCDLHVRSKTFRMYFSFFFLHFSHCIYIVVYISYNNKRTKNIFFYEQKVGMLLQKRTDTRGVGISSMRKSIYLLKTTPSSHTHRFHPLPLATPTSCSPHPLATPIHSTHSPQLSSIL